MKYDPQSAILWRISIRAVECTIILRQF